MSVRTTRSVSTALPTTKNPEESPRNESTCVPPTSRRGGNRIRKQGTARERGVRGVRRVHRAIREGVCGVLRDEIRDLLCQRNSRIASCTGRRGGEGWRRGPCFH